MVDLEDIACPQCKQYRLSCSFLGDVGGDERFAYRYRVECGRCHYSDIRTLDGGNPNSDNVPNDGSDNCPWCKTPADFHD